MKFINFVKKHIVGSFAILIGIVACVVGAVAFGTSRAEYNAYLKEYEAQQEKLKSATAQLPKDVYIDNDYVDYSGDDISSTKSSYKNKYLYTARTASIAPLSDEKAQEYKKIDPDDTDKMNEYISSLDRSGGAITFKIKAEESGLADVCISLASNWRDADDNIIEYENISDQIKIQFNKLEIKTEDCSLPALDEEAEQFETLVLKDVLLLKGSNPFTLTTSAYNPYKTDSNKILYVMPDIRNVAVISSVSIDMPEVE